MKNISKIESQFDTVVKRIGGVPLRELLDSKSPSFENADYLFPSENIITELKILEKDPNTDGELQSKVQAKFDDWMAEGKLFVSGTEIIHSKDLSPEMQWELMRIHSEPVKRVIKKANRQIRDTKAYLNRPHAQGHVIIVNEANRELQPEHLGFAAHQSLGRAFSSINGVSLLTINVGVTMPGVPSTLRLWMDYVRNDVPEIDKNFLLRFRKAWCDHYSQLIGEPVSLFEQQKVNLSSMKYT